MSTDTANTCNASVIGREQIHPELIVLRVRPDGKLFDFKPGQFAVLGLPGSAPRVPGSETETPAPDADKLIRRPTASHPPAWSGGMWNFTSHSSPAAG